MTFHHGLRFKILASIVGVLCLYQGVEMMNTAGFITLPAMHAAADPAASDAATVIMRKGFKPTLQSCKPRMERIYEALKEARDNDGMQSLSTDDLRCLKLTKAAPAETSSYASRPAKRDLIK